MTSDLTCLELEILEATLKQHAAKTSHQSYQLATLKVLRREPSGVGTYVVLDRDGQPPSQSGICHQLGFNGEITVPGVPSGLGAVVDIESGQLNHIELFTYGEETWNGDTSLGAVVPDSATSTPRG